MSQPSDKTLATGSQSHRQSCHHCGYLMVNCLCEHIREQSSPQKIIILQHPSEVKHAKNTARLVNLAIADSQIIVGENPADFSQLNDLKRAGDCALVYPSDKAQPIEHHQTQKTVSTLIFIDGSWRKAHKILALNPWLNDLPHLTFSQTPQSRYRIRKAPRKDSLATIEAVAYCLEQLNDTNTLPLVRLFEAMIDRHLSHIPKQLKHRY